MPLLIAAIGALNSWHRRAVSNSNTRKWTVLPTAACLERGDNDARSAAPAKTVVGVKRSIPYRAIYN